MYYVYPFLPFFFLPATIFAIPLASSVNRSVAFYNAARTHARTHTLARWPYLSIVFGGREGEEEEEAHFFLLHHGRTSGT